MPVPVPSDEWDVEGFRSFAHALTIPDGHGGADRQFGFWLPRWTYSLLFLWAFGAEMTDETGANWRLLGPEAEAALESLRSLVLERVCPRDEDVPQVAQDVGFLTGRVAMCINGPWFQPFLERTRLKNGYRVLPVPRGPAGRATRVTWDGVIVRRGLSGSRRRNAALLFRFLVSEEAQARIARTGRAVPALRRSVPAFAEGGDARNRRTFVEAAAYARAGPSFPEAVAVDRVLNARVSAWLFSDDGKTSGQLLEELARDPVIQRAFATGGSERNGG